MVTLERFVLTLGGVSSLFLSEDISQLYEVLERLKKIPKFIWQRVTSIVIVVSLVTHNESNRFKLQCIR